MNLETTWFCPTAGTAGPDDHQLCRNRRQPYACFFIRTSRSADATWQPCRKRRTVTALFMYAPPDLRVDFTTGRFVRVNDVMCPIWLYRRSCREVGRWPSWTEDSRRYLTERLGRMLSGHGARPPEYELRGKVGR
jgi:hypothetical protein